MTDDIPEPLTPADCDLRDFPFMPLHIARLQRSRAWLQCKRKPELAFYLLNLWMRAWHEVPAASLDDDDDVLADAAMADPKQWAKLRAEVLRGWVKCSDGRLYHPVVAELAIEAFARKIAQRERTEAARQARSRARSAAVTTSVTESSPPTATSNATVSVTETATDTVTSSKGQGQGQGQGQGEREQQRSSLQDPTPARARASPDTAAAVAVIALFDERSRAHFGEQTRAFPAATDVVMAQRWLAAGASMPQLRAVFDARMNARKSKGKGPIGTLSYLDDAVAEELRRPPPITARDPTGRRIVDLNLIAG